MYKTPLEAWHYGFVEEGNFERESYYINDAAVHLADAIASNGNIETLCFMKNKVSMFPLEAIASAR